MILIFLWNISTWIAAIICILLFVMTLVGKLAPKFATCLVLGIVALGFLINYAFGESGFINRGGQESIPTPAFGSVAKEYNLLQKYLVKDKELWTYSISGDWTWDTRFVKKLELETGWKKIKKKGNYTIVLTYKGIIKDLVENGERSFKYSGGEVEIRINGELCCCEGVISIPAGLDGKNVKVVNQEIQKAITELMFQNKEAVIRKIHSCL